MRRRFVLSVCLLSLLGCDGPAEQPWRDAYAGPPRLQLCIGASPSRCLQFDRTTPPYVIGYDRSDGSVFIGVKDSSSYRGGGVGGQQATLGVFVDNAAQPVVSAETVVNERLEGSFRIPYCGVLAYRNAEVRFVVTVKNAQGSGGEARRVRC